MRGFNKALIAGGLVLVTGPFCFLSQAQDYVDVEAERAAAKRAREAAAGQTPPPGNPAPVYGTPAPAAQPVSPAPAPAATPQPYGVRPAQPATPASIAPETQSAPAVAGAGNDIGSLLYQVQQLQQEVMRLNGMVEEQAYELRQLKEQSLERYVDLDKRVSALGAGGTAIVTGGNQGAGVAGSPSVPEQAGEADAYRAAYSLVRSQQFDDAVSAFQKFLNDYPGGKYAANAHYWLGELYLVVDPQDLEGSRQAFSLLLSEYPDNPKVPDAQYKLGKVHYMKGNPERGKEYFDQVIAQHGNSSAARLAREFVSENY